MSDAIGRCFPQLAKRLPKLSIAELPTPVRNARLQVEGVDTRIAIKCDDLTSSLYGGNKVRKLEYLLQRALQRRANRVATFGTVASNHAIATALHATRLNLGCTCFLSHQEKSDKAAAALRLHLQNGTEVVSFGGDRRQRIATLRRHLAGRRASLIPLGGSSWLGAIGFVNAGLELAGQIAEGQLEEPGRIYLANGTMGTAAGLALGLALGDVCSEVHAIRVTHPRYANPAAMQRLLEKTALLMHRFDPAIPADLAQRCRLQSRDGFFAGGYARSDRKTERAVAIARDALDLQLETTYTGKAMAALLHDARAADAPRRPVLFWNSYNSARLPDDSAAAVDSAALPAEFLRYFD